MKLHFTEERGKYHCKESAHQQYQVVRLGLGLVGSDWGLGQRASWPVHGWCMVCAWLHGDGGAWVHGGGDVDDVDDVGDVVWGWGNCM